MEEASKKKEEEQINGTGKSWKKMVVEYICKGYGKFLCFSELLFIALTSDLLSLLAFQSFHAQVIILWLCTLYICLCTFF